LGIARTSIDELIDPAPQRGDLPLKSTLMHYWLPACVPELNAC